jgi:hypothetical protein
VAYPLGLPAVIAGEGETYEEAVADVHSAMRFDFKHYAQAGEIQDMPEDAFLIETDLDAA